MTINTFVVMGALIVMSLAAMSLALPVSSIHTGVAETRNLIKRDTLSDEFCKILGDSPCRKVGESCGCPNVTHCEICNEGSTCHNGLCEANSQLGGSCTTSLDCHHLGERINYCNDDGFCVAPDEIFQAGETCYPNNTLFYNGGCEDGLSCSDTTKKCSPHYVLGEDCEDNDAGCGRGAFCHSQTKKCVALLKEGDSCANETKSYGGRDVCQTMLVCHEGQCAKRFSRGEGQACSSGSFLCKSGLVCTSDFTLTRDNGECKKMDGFNERCLEDDSICGLGSYCLCDYKTKQARCVSPISPTLVKAMNKLYSCLDKNGLDSISPFFGSSEYPANDIALKCSKQYKTAVLAEQFFGYGEGKYCSGASSLMSSLSIVVALTVIIAYLL